MLCRDIPILIALCAFVKLCTARSECLTPVLSMGQYKPWPVNSDEHTR